MPKTGVDDFLAAGHSVAELKTLARKFEPADIGRMRLSQDQKLWAAMSDLWQTWRDYDWMHLVGTARRGNWQRGHTVRDVVESLLELAERCGKLDERGVVVRASHRLLVEMSAKSRPSVRVALKHAEAEGMLEVLESESEGKARRYRLLVPRAAFYHKGEGVTDKGEVTSLVQRFDPGGKGLRAPTASRLRWSSPARKARRLRGVTPGTRRVRQTRRFHKDITVKESRIHFPDTPFVKRLGPHRCAVLDALETAGGTLTLRELCEVLHRNRPRDVRRRILPMLEEVRIIDVEGDVIRLAADWLARLEEERERSGEISHAEEQREKHRKQRERYRDYLRTVKRQPSQAGREVIERGRELRYTHLRAQPPPDQPSEAAPSPLAEAVREYLDRHPHQARQPAGWIGVTLWAEGLHPKLDDPPAQTRAAIRELGGAAYLDAKLKEAKGVA
jgi:hypothetical protein